MASPAAKIRIGGTWSGVLEVDLDNWKVPMLRNEVARRSNLVPEAIKLISGGKVLIDGDGTESLSQLGLKNNTKILSSRAAVDKGKSLMEEAAAEEERSRRLCRIRAAADALSKRHADGSLPTEDYDLDLEDQSGRKLQFSETDKQGIMMGLMLHTSGKSLIRKQMFKDALEVLTMGEEAFSLCDSKSIELVDNIPILQIDIVWCYFMLQDIAWLSLAGVRLERAREGLERSHGKDVSRFRLLQAGRSADLALYLRLELLEGVVAYHNGHFDRCKEYLISAQAKFSKLQIPDEALSLVISLGFKVKEAKRALRMCSQNAESAINFLMEEKEIKAQKREENIRRRDEIMEQKQYGVTPLKKAVNLDKLKELVTLGFEKELAAEALRRNENDIQKALDDLTNPEANTVIQCDIESRKRKRQERATTAKVEQLVSMGFERSQVMDAVRSGEAVDQVMQRLLASSGQSSSVATNSNVEESSAAMPNPPVDENDDQNEGPPADDGDQRDMEMEDEIADELARADAFSDYDIEVTKEGEAIMRYLAMLDSAGTNGKAASSQ